MKEQDCFIFNCIGKAYTYKHKRKLKSRIDNPKTHASLGIRHRMKRNKTKHRKLKTNMRDRDTTRTS